MYINNYFIWTYVIINGIAGSENIHIQGIYWKYNFQIFLQRLYTSTSCICAPENSVKVLLQKEIPQGISFTFLNNIIS